MYKSAFPGRIASVDGFQQMRELSFVDNDDNIIAHVNIIFHLQ